MRSLQTTSHVARPGNRGIVAFAVALLTAWCDRSRQRRHLRDLDDRMLRDVGICRHDVEREVDKPFWRA